MPYALCPMPYARRVPHVTEKGYTSIFCLSATLALMLLLDSLFTVRKIRELVQQALRISYLTVAAKN